MIQNDDVKKDELKKEEKEATSTASMKTLPHVLMPKLDRAFSIGWTRALLLVAFVLPMAFLLGPSLGKREQDLGSGLVVGARAANNIKATRDFDYYPSDDEIEKQRLIAAKTIRPVFDYSTDRGAVLLSRISRAFRAMNERIAQKNNQTKLPKIEDKKDDQKKKALKVAAKKTEKTQTPEDWRRTFSNLLQVQVSETIFDDLKKANFAADIRAAIVVLVGAAMDQMVIAHRGAIQAFVGKPITVRRLVVGRPGSLAEESLSSFSRIKDLEQAKKHVRHLSNVHGAKLNPKLRKAVLELVESIIEPNFEFNPTETTLRKNNAMAAIQARPLHFVKGQVLIRDGDPITKEKKLVVMAMSKRVEGVSLIQVISGLALFVLLFIAVIQRFATVQFKRFDAAPRDLLMMGALLIGMLALTRGVTSIGGFSHHSFAVYLFPAAGGAMLVRLLVSAEAAALFSVVAASLLGLLINRSLDLTFYYIITSLVASFGVLRVQSRGTVLRAGLIAGIFGGLTVFCLQMFGGAIVFKSVFYAVLAAIGGGLLASFTALALLPAIEWVFAYTTDISLLELANLNHPLMRDLMLRAPGTYHHSMVVGNLAEAGCDAIGANGLLARVAAYYHDVGKMKNAAYFAENFRDGDNPHNRLKPSMSSLIIRSHVKDGIEMMREHGIPEIVIDTASQHHGTAMIAFFYHKAVEQKDEEEEVLEEDYRYPGPKPQSREAGIIMVADGVEAAARSLVEPTDDRLRAVVQKIINTQFTDGQLDHCDLTLRDLHLIAKSFLQVLTGIYHARPTYPWQKRGDETRGRKRESLKHRTVSRDETENTIHAEDVEVKKKDSTTTGKMKRKQKADAKNGKHEDAQREPANKGEGEGSDQTSGAATTASESSPDIKRLGLN